MTDNHDKAGMLITDEIVEKAARAGYNALNPDLATGSWSWEEQRDDGGVGRDKYRAHARAALTAVLPDLIEACAESLERCHILDLTEREEAQLTIRSLSSKGNP